MLGIAKMPGCRIERVFFPFRGMSIGATEGTKYTHGVLYGLFGVLETAEAYERLAECLDEIRGEIKDRAKKLLAQRRPFS